MKKNYHCLLVALSTLTLPACSTYYNHNLTESNKNNWKVPEFVQKTYAAVDSEPYPLPAINLQNIEPKYWRQNVYYPTQHAPGTVLVDTDNRFLYYTLNDNQAIRYGIGVGKDGLALKGNVTIAHKRAWPHWTPTREMMKRDPDRYGHLGLGMPPGTSNPLGARALYLYRQGQDSHFRIHGSHEEWSIGKAVSSGCIRMLNQDIIDLYERVTPGTKVVVL